MRGNEVSLNRLRGAGGYIKNNNGGCSNFPFFPFLPFFPFCLCHFFFQKKNFFFFLTRQFSGEKKFFFSKKIWPPEVGLGAPKNAKKRKNWLF